MRIIKEYAEFTIGGRNTIKPVYYGKFMGKSIYVSVDFFKWGDKTQYFKDGHEYETIRTIDIIRRILATDSSLKINNYQDFITYTLGYLYDKSIIHVNEFDIILPQSFDTYNSNVKSILNYINTNRLVQNYILKLYNETNINSSELFKKIWKDKEELFLENGKYFKTILEKLQYSTKTGVKLENNILTNTLEFFKKKLNDNSIILTQADLRDDLLKGIDIKIVSNENKLEKTIQVKPIAEYSYKEVLTEKILTELNSINNSDYSDKLNKNIINTIDESIEKSRVFKISSTSVTKHYNTDYIIFTKESENKIFILENNNIIIDHNKHTYILVNPNIQKDVFDKYEIIYLY